MAPSLGAAGLSGISSPGANLDHSRDARPGGRGGAVLSRETFDAELVREAVRAGVAFLPGTSASLGGCAADGRRVALSQEGRRAEVCADLVLAADGLGSSFLRGEAARMARLGAGA